MKRVRYRSYTGIRWGELDGGYIDELSGMMGIPTGHRIPLSEVSLLPPCEPNTIICVGRNYVEHIRELGNLTGTDLPTEPGLFLKGVNTLTGTGDDIPHPDYTENLHYEGELAVVISRTMRNITEDEAFEHILGFTGALDITARDVQGTDLQWVRAKSADGFCPIGPWVETELDPSNVRIQTRVNGEVRQDGNTADMIFSIPKILAYISLFMTLEPGDVVLTGTPEGVGTITYGDRIELEIEGIGMLVNQVEERS